MAFVKERFRQLHAGVANWNIFQTHTPVDDDPYEHKTQLISTRLLVALLVLSTAILFIYTSQVPVTHTITIDFPSLSQYLSLYDDYGEEVSCPCTNLAFHQETFMTLTPKFHQVCSSAFVTTQWTSVINAAARALISLDFRYTGSVLFQILTSFCQLAEKTITDSLLQFYSNNFVSGTVMNMKLLEDESESLINSYITTTANSFIQALDSIQAMTFLDGLVSGLFTNVKYKPGPYDDYYLGYLGMPNSQSYDELVHCNCEQTPTCIAPVAIHTMISNRATNQTLFTIPGLYVGCYLVTAMRQSNLQCLYNQSCLTELLFYLNSSVHINITALDEAKLIRFNKSTTVGEMLAVILVDSWTKNISYASYYAQCQPSYCTYSFVGKNSFLYILTLLIGLFGGIYKVLKVSVPLVVKFIRNRIRGRRIHPITIQEPSNTPTAHVLRTKVENLFQTAKSVNLFPSYPPSTDQYQLKMERITTFAYVTSLIICLLCLLIYTANQQVTQTITFPTPSLEEYRSLYAQEGDRLSCSCSAITSRYKDFTVLEPKFHQFCNSGFVQDKWLSYAHPDNDLISRKDFRISASLIFHGLASYCSISNRTISNEITLYQSTHMITAELLTEEIFFEKSNQRISSFITEASKVFLQNLRLIRKTTNGNQLLTREYSNTIIFFRGSYPKYGAALYPSNIYSNCSCFVTPKCVLNTAFFRPNGSNFDTLFSVPGLYIGCYTSDALLQSTLECFFNQTCVDTLKFYLNHTTDFHVTALDPTVSSQFNQYTLVRELLNHTMIDQWKWNVSYSKYFSKCQPSSCYYRQVSKTPWIIVFTTLIALFGGLVKILQVTVPLAVKLARYRRNSTNTENTHKYARLRNLCEKIVRRIRHLNLFRTKTPLDDTEQEVYTQILSTRLLIVHLSISMIILLVYTSQIINTRTITLDSPSFSRYGLFYKKHREKLTCPCSTITVTRKNFLSLEPIMHPICSSAFTESSWGEEVAALSRNTLYNRDFRARTPRYFQLLAAFCEIGSTSLTEAIDAFEESSLISANIISEEIFYSRMNASIDVLINSTINSFVRAIDLLQNITFGNGLMSVTLSSISFNTVAYSVFQKNDSSTWNIDLRYKIYNSSNTECSCHDTSKCVEQAFIWQIGKKPIPLFSIPGMLIGCYVFDAMLQSDLHLFYNQTKVDWLRASMNMTRPANVTALDPSKLKRFQVNSTIGDLVQNMLVEEIKQNISYKDYYTQCQPRYCRYSSAQKNDALYMITTITALIGGLTSAFQLIIPRVVKIVRRFGCKTDNRQ